MKRVAQVVVLAGIAVALTGCANPDALTDREESEYVIACLDAGGEPQPVNNGYFRFGATDVECLFTFPSNPPTPEQTGDTRP